MSVRRRLKRASGHFSGQIVGNLLVPAPSGSIWNKHLPQTSKATKAVVCLWIPNPVGRVKCYEMVNRDNLLCAILPHFCLSLINSSSTLQTLGRSPWLGGHLCHWELDGTGPPSPMKGCGERLNLTPGILSPKARLEGFYLGRRYALTRKVCSLIFTQAFIPSNCESLITSKEPRYPGTA